MRRAALTFAVVLAVACVGLVVTLDVASADAHGEETTSIQSQAETVRQAYQELFDISIKSGNSLAFHVGGQTIGGVVTRLIGDQAVEVRNREFSRIVLRLDRIDAVAAY